MAAVRRRVFISHIHEEAALAGVIRDWVNDAFTGSGVTAFVSSDRDDLPAGRNWLDAVRENLAGSEVLVAVLSSTAVQRPWPNIELGAGWIQGLAVIPFCHSGLRTSDLDRPFGDFQGVNIDDKDAGQRLLGGIAHAIKLKFPANLQFDKFNAALLAVSRRVTQTAAPRTARLPSNADRSGLPEQQIVILQILAEALNAGQEYVPLRQAVAGSGLSAAQFQNHSNQLEERGFIHIAHYEGGPDVKILAPGSGWLEDHGML